MIFKSISRCWFLALVISATPGYAKSKRDQAKKQNSEEKDDSPTPKKRMTSREVREERSGNASLLPIVIQYVPSTMPLAGIGTRVDGYVDDRLVLGFMLSSTTSKYDNTFTRVTMLEGQARYHLRNSFYIAGGLGLRSFERSGVAGSYRTGIGYSKTYRFDTTQFVSSGGLGNHWSWRWVSLGVQWFGISIPSPGVRFKNMTESKSEINDEETEKKKKEFKGDATEVQWNLPQLSIGVTF